jgi:hypothetical protein
VLYRFIAWVLEEIQPAIPPARPTLRSSSGASARPFRPTMIHGSVHDIVQENVYALYIDDR